MDAAKPGFEIGLAIVIIGNFTTGSAAMIVDFSSGSPACLSVFRVFLRLVLKITHDRLLDGDDNMGFVIEESNVLNMGCR